jgi:hypothetical protein
VTAQNAQRTAQVRLQSLQQAGAGKEVTLQVVRGQEELSLKAKLREGRFGLFLTPGDERFPTLDVESMVDPARQVRELNRRVQELEKRDGMGEIYQQMVHEKVVDYLQEHAKIEDVPAESAEKKA